MQSVLRFSRRGPGVHSRLSLGVLAIALTGLLLAIPAGAAVPTYSNGFDVDTAGWFNTIAQEASGSNGAAAYAPSVASASGAGLARVGAGAFTRWGGYNLVFPVGGYTTQIDIYLDVDWAANHPDARFDFTSAINNANSTVANPNGEHLRDFAFNAGTNRADDQSAPGFYVGASTNTGRANTFPQNTCPAPSLSPNTCRTPVHITTSGWYTFRHTFRDGGGFLAVDLEILSANAAAVASWTISSTTDLIGGIDPTKSVGCNRYGWFPNEEIPGLPIDNSQMTGCGTPPVATLHATKFYDANANGIDDDGQPITGWKVKVSDGIPANDLIGLTPFTASGLAAGTYTVSEFSPVQANWFATTPSSVQRTVAAGDDTTVAFGNLCVGAGGGLTLGFWSNKNGALLVGADDLMMLRVRNLRGANGSNFDPLSVKALQTWLLKATATNMAYMLSAQLAAMELNVFNGKVSASALIYAPGTSSANAAGFATVASVMNEANIELGAHAVTLSGSLYRARQEALKTALDNANNNRGFVQSTPCAFSFS